MGYTIKIDTPDPTEEKTPLLLKWGLYIHHIVKINQLIILLPLLLAILKICFSLALLHITQLLILLLCLSLVFLNIKTQMGGLCRTRVHLGVV